MTAKIPIDTDWLRREYIEQNRSIRDIATELGCCMSAVHGAIKRADITMRQTGGQPRHGHKTAADPSGTPTYSSWHAMLGRCNNSSHPAFFRYGGRGIKICARWDPAQGGSFENFLADMGERPNGLTLDRVDGDGNYEPDNCRWATPLEQARQNRKLTDEDVLAICLDTRTYREIAEQYKVTRVLIGKIKQGHRKPPGVAPVPSPNPAIKLSPEVRQEIYKLYRSSHITQREIAKQYGIAQSRVSQIIRASTSSEAIA
jgi:transposase-like protein